MTTSKIDTKLEKLMMAKKGVKFRDLLVVRSKK